MGWFCASSVTEGVVRDAFIIKMKNKNNGIYVQLYTITEEVAKKVSQPMIHIPLNSHNFLVFLSISYAHGAV